MLVRANADGLYVVDIEVIGKKKSKKLKAVIDTGSTDCACTYEVITTLQIKPIDFPKVHVLEGYTRRLMYETNVSFGGHCERVPIIRVASIKGGVHFIFGMSILSKYDFEQTGSGLNITRRPS